MEYRQVGNTELRVSEIGFGCGGNAGLMVRGSPAARRSDVRCAKGEVVTTVACRLMGLNPTRDAANSEIQ